MCVCVYTVQHENECRVCVCVCESVCVCAFPYPPVRVYDDDDAAAVTAAPTPFDGPKTIPVVVRSLVPPPCARHVFVLRNPTNLVRTSHACRRRIDTRTCRPVGNSRCFFFHSFFPLSLDWTTRHGFLCRRRRSKDRCEHTSVHHRSAFYSVTELLNPSPAPSRRPS